MSTVKAINFQHPSASAANITLASDGTVSGGIPSPNRNLLYNGAMQVSQRGTSTASITANGYYTADRWSTINTTLGTWTQSVENDAPTGSGLSKSLKMLCTTADASPAAGDAILVVQRLEGQDCQRIAKGTSSAQQLTLSFWVKSNVTGTYIAELEDSTNTRRISASYTVSASATWEKKTITFAADTSGAITNDNNTGLIALFWLGAGSTWTGGSPLQTTWGTATNTRATGQTNLAAATNNYWQITGVQLETGSQATAFEFKAFGQELRECQRYYYRMSGGDAYRGFAVGAAETTTNVQAYVSVPVTMRVAPTSVESLNIRLALGGGGVTASAVAISGNQNSAQVPAISVTGTGLTSNSFYRVIADNSTSAYLAVSAEL